MKTLIFYLRAAILTVASCVFLNIAPVKAQSGFDGEWQGKIKLSSGSNLDVKLKINGQYVTQYFYDEDKDAWYPVSPVTSRTNRLKNNMMYYWMNNSVIWSETQTFMLSYVNDDDLYVVWSRQVNNQKDDDDNDVWSLQGTGYLSKL